MCVQYVCVVVCVFTPFNPFKSDSTATLVGYVNTLIIQMPQRSKVPPSRLPTTLALLPVSLDSPLPATAAGQFGNHKQYTV